MNTNEFGDNNRADSVQTAVRYLVQTVNGLGLPATLSSVDSSDLRVLQERLDLPEAIIEWYSLASPHDLEIPALGNAPVLYGAEELEEALIGYRSDAISDQVLAEWDPTWLVVGGEGEYPIIVRTQRANDPAVYYGMANSTSWDLYPLSDDLAGFLEGVGDYLSLYIGRYTRTVHENYVLNPAFRADLVAALKQRSSTRRYADRWIDDWLGGYESA